MVQLLVLLVPEGDLTSVFEDEVGNRVPCNSELK